MGWLDFVSLLLSLQFKVFLCNQISVSVNSIGIKSEDSLKDSTKTMLGILTNIVDLHKNLLY